MAPKKQNRYSANISEKRAATHSARGRGHMRSTWVNRQKDLQARQCPFRLMKRGDSPIIYIRQIVGGEQIGSWSTMTLRVESESDINAAHALCLKCQKAGKWLGVFKAGLADHTWQSFARISENAALERLGEKGSFKDVRACVRQWAKFTGKVCPERIGMWMDETDPIKQKSRFGDQIETIRLINKTGLMDLDAVINAQVKRRPTTAELRKLTNRDKPRAIASDLEMYDWLKSINDPLLQWAFAMIATYGLRPSEVWHIDDWTKQGIIHIPGRPICKTWEHPAFPCPMNWVEEFHLMEDFTEKQLAMHERWALRWQENANGVREPMNNSDVVNVAMYKPLYNAVKVQLGLKKEGQRRVGIPPCWARKWESGPGGGDTHEKDWVRPYDLRHSYAIRVMTHPETREVPFAQMAKWMGHSVQQHRDVYLKWMPTRLSMAAEMALFEELQALPEEKRPQEPTFEASPAGELPPEVVAQLEELAELKQKLKQLMGG